MVQWVHVGLTTNLPLEKIVKEIQTAEKIDVVIKKTAVILSEDSIDITSKVIEKLNKEVSTIDVNVTP